MSLPPKKFILLNGPPRCGKDTAASGLTRSLEWQRGTSAIRLGFADELKRATHVAYGLRNNHFLRELEYDHYESVKEAPSPDFFGLTPRQAYIAHSEKYMKPLHGKDICGKLFVRNLRFVCQDLIIVPDSGFVEENQPVIDTYGAENILLIKIMREGCSFSNDSRGYISLKGVTEYTVANNTIDSYTKLITSLVKDWLNIP